MAATAAPPLLAARIPPSLWDVNTGRCVTGVHMGRHVSLRLHRRLVHRCLPLLVLVRVKDRVRVIGLGLRLRLRLRLRLASPYLSANRCLLRLLVRRRSLLRVHGLQGLVRVRVSLGLGLGLGLGKGRVRHGLEGLKPLPRRVQLRGRRLLFGQLHPGLVRVRVRVRVRARARVGARARARVSGTSAPPSGFSSSSDLGLGSG